MLPRALSLSLLLYLLLSGSEVAHGLCRRQLPVPRRRGTSSRCPDAVLLLRHGHHPRDERGEAGNRLTYAAVFHDSTGAFLEGSSMYTVSLPGPIPAKNFWSFTVYDNQTRSLLPTDQKLAGLGSDVPGIVMNPDGGATIWFGPQPPAGHEKNWVQTMPNKGYNVLLRLYGPLEPWFNKAWSPGDFELQK